MPLISVIIPCLNESAHLAHLLEQLIGQENVHLEIIVADGGSTDDTTQIAAAHGIKVVHSNRGRGIQQNAGAAIANGDYLLFLHADSRFENECQLSRSVDAIEAAGKRTVGHYHLCFESEDPDIRDRLQLFEYKTGLNRAGTFNGDQGLLIRQKDFKLMGGFSEKYGFLEDKDFGERFAEFGQFITLPSLLYTSARRFESEGVRQRLLLNTLIMAMYHLELDNFFRSAPAIYQQHDSNQRGHLDPLPFFDLVEDSVFSGGVSETLIRCYRIGRYATRNLWQVCLWYGMKRDKPDRWLRIHDRYLGPVTDNAIGYLLGTLCVVSWFYVRKWRLALA